jgi:hypothetical protein
VVEHGHPGQREGTRWSWALVGFYLSCAGVALGATIGSAGYLWLESVPALVAGILLLAVSMVTCYTSLAAARRGSGDDARS